MSKVPALEDWPFWFPVHKIKKLEDMAAIGYTPEKLAMYFGINKKVFLEDFYSENSPIRYHYERGILLNEAEEAMATQKSANEGNATQAQRLDKKRFQIMFQQLKERIIYGKEI